MSFDLSYIQLKFGTFVPIYTVALVVSAFAVVAMLWRQYRKTVGAFARFRGIIDEFKKDRPEDLVATGVPQSLMDRMTARFEKSKDDTSRLWWGRIADHRVPYAGPRRDKHWFLAAAPAELLDRTLLIDRTFNSRMARSVSGFLTSAGLLGTFIAMMLGMWKLSVDSSSQITGIGDLISNLSGKFLSSIVALLLSLVASALELRWVRSLEQEMSLMLEAVGRTIPTLSQIVILRDLQEDTEAQSVSLSSISSEVIDRFQSVFTSELMPAFAKSMNDELQPTLKSIQASNESLRDLLTREQQSKQDSVVGEFRSLAEGLERSMKGTLEQLGRDFRASLSGATNSEFDRAAVALGASAEILRGLNESFDSMRSSLDAVVAEARRATSEQLASGAERATALNNLVEQLLVRLNDTASAHNDRIQNALVGTVERLHTEMQNLAAQMSSSVSGATSAATAAANSTVSAAAEVARQSQESSAELATRLSSMLERMKEVGDTLEGARSAVREAIAENAASLRQFQQAGAEVRATAAALAGTATSSKEVQESVRGTMVRVGETVVQLSQVARQQNETLQKQMQALGEVERVFEGLDANLGAVLGEITQRLQEHNRAIEQNFEAILSRVNKEMPRMGTALLTATDELSSNVEGLSDVLARMKKDVGRS